MLDYLDEDVAYFLGMIVARGTINETGSIKQLIIEFPYGYIETENVKDRNSLLVSIDSVMDRVSELTEGSVRKIQKENSADIIIEFSRRTILWRDVQMLLHGYRNYNEFEIPEQIFKSPTSIQKEFIRGFSDVGAKVRLSNAYYNNQHRVYIDVLNSNWKLPIQICKLLQDYIGIPVQLITWGHPNIRDSGLDRYKNGDKYFWKKEHQIKVFAEDFEEIGFYIKHKQDAFIEFVQENKKLDRVSRFCEPPKRETKNKPLHPMESAEEIPIAIRNNHYNSYWQICCDLGCERCKRQRTINRDECEKVEDEEYDNNEAK